MTRLMLYGLKTCDACRKAARALEGAGHALDFVDLRAMDGLAGKLPSWLAVAGRDRLLNTRSATWRGLSEADRASAETKDGLLSLLAAQPALIKRPVIESGASVSVGWSQAERTRYGL